MKKQIYTLALILAVTLLASANTNTTASQLYKAAMQEFDAKRYEASIDLFLKTDSAFVAEGLGNTPEYAQALHSTGRGYLNTDNFAEGRNYTYQALVLREKLFGKVSDKYITSLNNYALSYMLDSKLDEALKFQTEVIELCGKMNPPHPDEGMYLINLARIYYAKQDVDAAVKYMEEALPKVEKFSPNYEYVLNFLGAVYMDNNDNANVYRILGLMNEHDNHELEKECNTVDCHLERADHFMAIEDMPKAKDEFMAVFAMPLTEQQRTTVYQKYASFMFSAQDFIQAAEYYSLAANSSLLANGETDFKTSMTLSAASCYYLSSEYDKAMEAYKIVIADVDKYGYRENMKSRALQGLGNVYSAKKDYSQAIKTYKQWIIHLQANGHENEADYAKAYERLAAAEKFNKEYDESIADYKTAIKLYEEIGLYDQAYSANNGLELCLSYARKETGETADNTAAVQQRTDKIKEILYSTINTLEQFGDYSSKLSKAQSLATIAGCYRLLGDYANSIDYYTQYINAIRAALVEDFLLKNPKEREITWKQEISNINEMNGMLTELPQNTLDIFSRLTTLIYDGQLLSKGILLSSNIEFDNILNKYGTDEMKNQYRQIKDNLTLIERMREEHRPIEEIQTTLRNTDALQLALSRECADKGMFTDFLKYSSNDVLHALKPDEAAIEFVTLDTSIFAGEDLIIAVVISHQHPTGLSVVVCKEGLVNAIISDDNKFNNNDYTAAIWGGIMPFIQGINKIYFAPDGVLNNLGIEYLTLDGTPINETIEFSRLSSTREICRQHTSQPIQYAALFGNIDYMGDPAKASDKTKYKTRQSDGLSFDQLENTKREVSEIYSLLKKNLKHANVSKYTDEKASKAEFLSQDQLRINLLHIATHGKFINAQNATNIDAMDRSIIAFAGANLYGNIMENKGIVRASEIADMSLHDCELVVLSACESGLGKLGNDGVFGLQRGFKNAGAKTLLVSLSEVADASTADMMISFYRNLMLPNTTKREALKNAQAEIRAKYPDDNTWASFILIDSFD